MPGPTKWTHLHFDCINFLKQWVGGDLALQPQEEKHNLRAYTPEFGDRVASVAVQRMSEKDPLICMLKPAIYI